jgi:hypothetical protein
MMARAVGEGVAEDVVDVADVEADVLWIAAAITVSVYPNILRTYDGEFCVEFPRRLQQ